MELGLGRRLETGTKACTHRRTQGDYGTALLGEFGESELGEGSMGFIMKSLGKAEL